MLFWLLGCTISKPLPNLGDCATYSDEGFDYGTIDIGTCLSGVTDLAFRSTDDGELYLLMSNANPYVNFSGGSLLSVPWEAVDRTKRLNYSHDLPSVALPLPSFAGEMAFTDDDTALISVRFSEDSRTRTDADDIHLVDVSDPSYPIPSNRGSNGGSTLEVSSDPVAIAIDATTGMTFVGNRTSHDISVINSERTPMQVIPPWPLEVLGESVFSDEDDSNSLASLSRLETLATHYGDSLDSDEMESLAGLTDDYWQLDWIEGTWDLWTPSSNGYQRYSSVNAVDFSTQGVGDEFSSIETLLGEDVTGLFIWGAEAYFVLAGNIAAADWNAQDYTWQLRDNSVLSAEGLTLSSPSLVRHGDELKMIVVAEDDTGSWIAVATQDAGGNWRLGNSILDSDEGSIIDATIVEEFGLNQWRIFATVDGANGMHIQQWRSVDADWSGWASAGGLDVENMDIGAPVLSEEADRFRMWYAVGENGIWNIEYAESVDGEYWERIGPALSPNIESPTPPRVGMQATPMSAFRLEGESAGYQGTVEVGETAVLDAQGWALSIAAGQWLDTDLFGADSAGGLYIASQVDNISALSLTDATGTQRIGYLTALGEQGLWIEPEGDATSVESPTLWKDNDTWHLAYAEVLGEQGEQSRIVERTSIDGMTWSEATIILEPHDDWASMKVEPTDWLLIDGTPTLVYAGFDDSTWSIGLSQLNGATSTWTTSAEPWFDLGRPGSWDDSGVRDGKIQFEEDQLRLWYSGFDGEQWRVGSSLQVENEWNRLEEATVDQGWFHSEGVRRPLPSYINGQWFLYYGGQMDGVLRVGHAIG